MKNLGRWILLLAALAAAFGAGLWNSDRREGAGTARKVLYWVDPMNPSLRSPGPGTAPCGMPLEPVYEEGIVPGEASLPSGTMRISPERQQLIGIRVATVERKPETRVVRLLGRVAPDELRFYRVTAGTDGWIMRVVPVTTGSMVNAQELLATFYSYDVVTGIQSYLGSAAALERLGKGDAGGLRQNQFALVSAGKYRYTLRNMGVSEHQLDELDRTHQTPDEIEIRAPARGLVLSRNVSLDQRFKKGDELFQIVDLSGVWVLADLFGTDARSVKPGSAVKVALPDQGLTFPGRVSLVKPQFDPVTRTLKVRVEVENPDYLLRPDMFVDVELPEDCGPALLIPKEAVLDSGLQRTVFVAKGAGAFAPRKVTTGRRFGDQVEILTGLREGETVVASGNFLLDSESRMRSGGAIDQPAEPAIDPICGMDVNEAKARAAGLVSDRTGTAYYFCSPGCKKRFDADPAASPPPGR